MLVLRTPSERRGCFSFNENLRDDLLNGEIFDTLTEARRDYRKREIVL
jgi:hypothetical protein